MANIERLTAVRDYMLAHPEETDMQNWVSACGTQACVAGRAALMFAEDEGIEMISGLHDGMAVKPRHLLWETAGQQILGLTDDEATYLFYSYNDTVVESLDYLIEGKTVGGQHCGCHDCL